MKKIAYLLGLMCLFLFVGCSDDSETGSTASAAEVRQCKDGCDHLKFFDCNDSSEQSRCYNHCEAASPSQIELFAACTDSDICDPSCSTNIEPAPDNENNNPPNSNNAASSCANACEALVADSCIDPVNCSQACAQFSEVEKSVLVTCEAARDGCTPSSECSDLGFDTTANNDNNNNTTTPQDNCKAGCSTMATFQCIQSVDVSECRTICSTLDDDSASNFAACVNSGICEDASCYETINSNGASADVSGCKTTCDDLKFFDCVDSTQHSACRNLCETASASSIDTFKSCATGVCDDDSCYQSLQSAN